MGPEGYCWTFVDFTVHHHEECQKTNRLLLSNQCIEETQQYAHHHHHHQAATTVASTDSSIFFIWKLIEFWDLFSFGCGLGDTSTRTGLCIVIQHVKSIFYTDLYTWINEQNILQWLLTVLSLRKKDTFYVILVPETCRKSGQLLQKFWTRNM